MPARKFQPVCPHEAAHAASKLRPASHSYLIAREPLVAAIIASLCGILIYAGVWMIRLLG